MASNIPKFASFRPKPKAAPEPPKEPQKPSKAERPLKEEAISETTKAQQSEKLAHGRDALTSKTYYSDRRGDADVLRYGTLNRYHIPAYRRYGRGFVLGLSPDQKIDRDITTDKKIYVTPIVRRRQERLLTDKRLNKSTDRALRLVKTESDSIPIDLEFIALSSSSKRKRIDSDDDDEGTPDLDYRGIDGKPKSTEPADVDTQYESDTETIKIDAEVTRKNSEHVRKTKEHPADLQGWLAFIDHQEAMLKLDRPSSELTASDKAHLADVRISIYEEATKKIGTDHDSQIKLYAGLLTEARRAWDETKLASKWNEVLAKHPQSVDLWFMYLDFVQSSFAKFKYENCRSTFLKCLEVLRASASGLKPEDALHILLRLTSIMQESGYQELALAIWQALIEVHFVQNAPNAKLETTDAISAFSEFWESEAPRVGEEGANGWMKSSPNDITPSGSLPLRTPDQPSNVFEDFRMREIDAIEKLRYPGRTSDDVGEDDAFHSIFFSDIADYLNILPAATERILILEAFLCFCSLPPLPRVAQHQEKWRPDPFLHRNFHSASHLQDQSSQFTQLFAKFSNCPLKNFQMTSELLFEQDFPLDGINLSPDFVRRLLKLLTTDLSCDEVISEYLLAFELRHFPSDAFKTAKQLLKARPTSMRLYNVYGLLELRRGNTVKANQVFSMALSMQKGDVTLSMAGSLELLSSWVWEALHRGEHMEALWRLVSPLGKVPERDEQDERPAHSLVLRTRTIISETSERALLRKDYQSAVLATSLVALMAYLSNDCNPERALDAHQHLTAWLASNKLSSSPPAELHAQQIARFLIHHACHTPIVKPALIRTTLEPLISLFPNNTHLLSLYAANEARFSIDDRVRSIMHQTALQRSDATSVAGWAFTIHYETLKGEIAGSTAHSIRALYKRAVDGTGAHCPALWKAYIHFELEQLRLEQVRRPDKKERKDAKKGRGKDRVEEAGGRVKETFYQGVRRLPWCKDFIMLAFTDARGVFTEEELWRLYRVLMEKELRLYVDLVEPDV
ncbi:DUF1740-domain-containing protein [Cucurbitaria berberidis CBS 394.84]|uniref:DUF1740-domain-containing protein n=1 Tax=Cucurbitaria berberidis CBS 394.84 TaxID=1168544 RepID=A0A9P4GFD9_9PLEO|nr:DUF1740-domain-containing protein [Cucurbitaria berberidis CBS 394.84]KAF1844439.1 DUF1740-domain-containing protein [Cucurbitaria berberidis CBS 394.84]